MEIFHDVSKDIFKNILRSMSKCRFLEMEIEALASTVSLLTAWMLFLLVATGSYDRIGMWSLKIYLLVHERPKKLV